MPDQPEVLVAKNPFDLGDTSTDMSVFAREASSEKPRNPDGTFAPANQEQAGNAAQPEADVSPPPAPAAAADPWREQLVRQAVELGYSDEELAAFKDNAALSISLNRTMKQQLAFQKELLRAQTLMDKEVRQPEPQQSDEFAELGVNPDTGRPYTEEDFNPAFRAILKKNKELETRLNQKDQMDMQRNFNDVAEAIDEVFEGFGPEWESILGAGSGVELVQNKHVGLKRRMAVLAEVGIGNVNAITPAQVRRAAVKMKKAAIDLYGPGIAKAAPAPNPYAGNSAGRESVPEVKPPISEEDWEEAAVAVPTSRPPAELPNGDEKAIRNLTAKIAERRTQRGRTSDAEIRRGMFPGGSTAPGSGR